MQVGYTTLSDPLTMARRPIRLGLGALVLSFVCFGGWAATAPLASGSLASGAVAVSSKRQTIQHLEGGIIAEVKVREGDYVEAGDLLIRFDDTKARSTLEIVRQQYLSALGEQARLQAERDGAEAIKFPPELDGAEGAEITTGQTNVFRSRRDYVAGQEQLTRERTLQIEREIESLEAQKVAEERKLELIKEELQTVEDLYKRGFEKRPRLLALQRTVAEIEGNIGQYAGRVAKSHQAISELAVQLLDIRNRLGNETVTQLRATETKIADVLPRMRAAQDVLNRLEVRATRDSFVVNLAYFSPGGVIDPGKPILDLVPKGDRLLVDTRLDPRDIDVLHVGLDAVVTLTPYSRRSVPPIPAKLVMLTADSLTEPKTGATYYLGQVEIDAGELARYENVKLVPGMPAEVMIRTGDRTLLHYLFEPLLRSVNRAFRER